MSYPIGPRLKPGPYPGALLLDIADKHERLFLAPLDKPGPSQRDEIMIGAEQRTTGSPIIATLDVARAATIVKWIDSNAGGPSLPSFRVAGPILSIDTTGPTTISRDLLTFVWHSEVELAISFEHWTSGMVRKHREVMLTESQRLQVREWLRAFWFDGLPGVPRRRGGESADEFAARAAHERAERAR